MLSKTPKYYAKAGTVFGNRLILLLEELLKCSNIRIDVYKKSAKVSKPSHSALFQDCLKADIAYINAVSTFLKIQYAPRASLHF